MNTVSFANPSHAGSMRILRRHLDTEGSSHDFDILDFFGEPSMPLISLLLMLAGGLSLAVINPGLILWAGGPVAGLTILGAVWKLLRSRKTVGWRYNRHLQRGNIIEVPAALVAMWDDMTLNIPSFTRWTEYEQRRFDAFSSILAEASHLFRPLLGECRCGVPESCDSTTHLRDRQKLNIWADVSVVLDAKWEEHRNAFLAARQAIDEMRTVLNA